VYVYVRLYEYSTEIYPSWTGTDQTQAMVYIVCCQVLWFTEA